MAHGPTRYEITARNERTGEEWLIAYAARYSKQGMIAAINARPDAICAALKLTGAERMEFYPGFGKIPHARVLEWRIAFTGLTQREAKQLGAKRYIGDALSAAA